MKNLNSLICSIAAGAALVTALPAAADSRHDRGYDRDYRSERYHDRRHEHDYRHFGGHDRRHVVVVERPYVVQRAYVVAQPVYYYPQPAPQQNYGPAAMIGSAIGGYIDSQR